MAFLHKLINPSITLNNCRFTLWFTLCDLGSAKVTFSQDLVESDYSAKTHMTHETQMSLALDDLSNTTVYKKNCDLQVLFTNKLSISVLLSDEHPQAPNKHKLKLYVPREGLEGHAGLGQDLWGEDLSVPWCSVHWTGW